MESTAEVKIEIEEGKATKEQPSKDAAEEKEKENEGEESQKLLNPEEKPSEEVKVKPSQSLYEISAALSRTRNFTQKLRNISVEKPPTRNPFSYIAAVFGLCFTGTAVGLGICCCVGGFLILEIIPIAAIVVGAVYWDRDRYCSAENIPLLLIIGGALKVLHITLSTAAGREQSNARTVVGKLASTKKKVKKSESENEPGPGVELDVEANKDKEQDGAKAENTGEDGSKEEVKGVDGKGQDDEVEVKIEPEGTTPQKTNTEEGNPWFRLGNAFLSVSEITWFITATVIIYGMYSTVQYSKEDSNLENYCHKSLYRFAFFYITFFYVLLGILVFVPMCLCCCGCLALLVSAD